MNQNQKYLIVNELLTSSDSSDDEMEAICATYLEKRNLSKILNFVEVIEAFDDIEFRRNFRVNKSLCKRIIQNFAASQHFPQVHLGKAATTPEIHIYSFLWYAANKSTIREISLLFNLAESTFHECFERVINHLLEIAPSVIKFPHSEAEKRQTSESFETISGVPGVLGCIDGTYIEIRVPVHKIRSTYVNRHDKLSITLQAICDASMKFIDVFTGTSSRIHDSRVYDLSFISKRIPEICRNEYFIIGDGAYPIREWIMKSYKDFGNLSAKEKNFNVKISATRVKSENAFALLKSRFRQLIRLDFWSVEKQAKFTIACCVLHNLCLEEGDEFDDFVIEYPNPISIQQDEHIESENHLTLKRNGENKRNQLSDLLFHLN